MLIFLQYAIIIVLISGSTNHGIQGTFSFKASRLLCSVAARPRVKDNYGTVMPDDEEDGGRGECGFKNKKLLRRVSSTSTMS